MERCSKGYLLLNNGGIGKRTSHNRSKDSSHRNMINVDKRIEKAKKNIESPSDSEARLKTSLLGKYKKKFNLSQSDRTLSDNFINTEKLCLWNNQKMNEQTET